MNNIKNLKQIQSFVNQLKKGEPSVKSTGAKVVYISDDLYNVDGSSDDPKKIPNHEGENWNSLLQSYDIDGNCYVTNAHAPDNSSHPDFSVGGHMTTNSNGKVEDGGICYLMPLCSWHNNKARDGVNFTHTQTKMLELSGYMTDELPVTFKLRMPSEEPYVVLFHHEDEWKFENISSHKKNNLKEHVFHNYSKSQSISHYVIIERKQNEKNVGMTYGLIKSILP
ncbi:hypothetical protein MY04_4504 [Flammeovirga sp. MY04]|uniref:hypothetical protein n=1 Tax=Flammeovirga sp. MY04 TaxID=1191459 RepID=UPI0008064315|nr:hypothetical protein [Flammeovirga sp. MY04]ANQ51839.1 hypothetical protein MY04_4504 [Flammeovirga sp. MY04]